MRCPGPVAAAPRTPLLRTRTPCRRPQALASELFHNPDALLVLHGGELGSRTSAARLLGAAPGYVGYGAGGLLTEALRRRPHCVVLLQHADKAHPEAGPRALPPRPRVCVRLSLHVPVCACAC